MARVERSPWTLAAAATVFLLPIAYSPSVFATFWSPKSAVLLVAGAAGLTRLPDLLRTDQRRPAQAAIALVAVATASTLVSPAPVNALLGLYNWGTGLVFVACGVGVWALGASADREDALPMWALLAGCAASVAVAILQTVVELPFAVLEQQGRAIGLAGNAVHLGTVATLGLTACAFASLGSRPARLAGVALFAAGVQVSGTRTALGVIVLVVAASWLVWRQAVVLVVAAAVAGIVAASALSAGAGVATATSRSTSERAFAAETGGGMRVRAEVWVSSRHAVARRPVLGHGPGRFRAATSADRTAVVAAAEGAGAIYSDAHNLLVEHAVTTGLGGVAALAAFVALALRRGRGPWLAVAVAGLGTSLLQPQSVGTTPLVLLALGAAAGATPPAGGRRATIVRAVAIGVAAVLGVLLLAGDVLLLRARDSLELADARRADAVLGGWPITASIRARAHDYAATTSTDAEARADHQAAAIRWRREAVERDPTDPGLLRELAEDERAAGLIDDAVQHYLAVLRYDPFDPVAARRLDSLDYQESP